MKRFIGTILLVLIGLMMPQMLRAQNEEFEKSYNFQCFPMGNGVLHFKLLAWSYSKGYNHWAGECTDNRSTIWGKNLTNGGGDIRWFVWSVEENDDYEGYNNKSENRSGGTGKLKLRMYAPGGAYITNLSSGILSDRIEKAVEYTELSCTVKRETFGPHYRVFIEFDYHLPAEYMEKQWEVKAHVLDERSNAHWDRNYNLGTFNAGNMPSAPTLYDPVFYGNGTLGPQDYAIASVPYSSMAKVHSMQPSFSDGTSMNRVNNPKQGDLFYVELRDEPRHLTANFDVDYNNTGSSHYMVNSNTIEVPAYHAIYDLAVNPVYEDTYPYCATGGWELTWKVPHSQYVDIMPTDIFLVERAHKADFSDAVTIDQVDLRTVKLSKNESQTENEDTTLVYRVIDDQSSIRTNGKEFYDSVYYRVRRATARSMGNNNRYTATIKVENPYEYTALWLHKKITYDEAKHTVRIPIEITSVVKKGRGFRRFIFDPAMRIRVERYSERNDQPTVFIIPADSLHKEDDEPNYTFVDQLPAACENFRYKVVIDTLGLTFPRRETDSYYGYETGYMEDATGRTDFAFYNIPAISNITASQDTYKDRVLITWEPDAPGIEYYDLYRDNELIGQKLTTTYYIDTVQNGTYLVPGKHYNYKVKGYINCNGLQVSESGTIDGWRSIYGEISGRVMYKDGTAMPSVSVLITNKEDKTTLTCTTDDQGFFHLDSILYNIEKGTIFEVSPQDKYAVFANPFMNVELTAAHPVAKTADFLNSQQLRLSGRILYENSTVPCVGVHFLVNGHPAMTASGIVVESDNLGNFTLTVPKNAPFTLQAELEGHTFLQNGFVEIEGSRDLSLTKNLDGVRIWDQTRTTLIGRIAGGVNQGNLPLGQALSHNNLGDDLQMVLELEGDNISHLVYDDKDKNYKTYDTIYQEGNTRTWVRYEQKRIIIRPDSLTGEFCLKLIPANYKLTQATAKGYATLMEPGRGLPTILLRDAPAQAEFIHIYHSPVSATYTPILYGMVQDYAGERSMFHYDLNGDPTRITTAWRNEKTGVWNYSFGYPVFASYKDYTFRIEAHEDYYYNNDKTNTHEQVMMANCPVKIYNGLNDAGQTLEATLNDNGFADVVLSAQNTSFSLSGTDALRHADVSVLVNGQYVQTASIAGFVTGTRRKAGGMSQNMDSARVLSTALVVTDVLRDPPGAFSYATVEAGTRYETMYMYHRKLNAGVKIIINKGTATSMVTGTVAGAPGPFTGLSTTVDNGTEIPIPAAKMWYDNYDKWTYTFTTSTTIQTSSNPDMVGADATVYIGMEPAIYTVLNESFNVLDDETFRMVEPSLKTGKIVEIAGGTDENGQPIHLVISNEIQYTTGVNNTFAYTRRHILRNIIPQLIYERDAYLMVGDSASLQQVADQTGRVVYRSLVDTDDENFGLYGHYRMIYPQSMSADDMIRTRDEVEARNLYLAQWRNILRNEEVTQLATKMLNPDEVYSIADGTAVTRSETTSLNTYNQTMDNAKTLGQAVATPVLGELIPQTWTYLWGKAAGAISKVWDRAANATQLFMAAAETQFYATKNGESLDPETMMQSFSGVGSKFFITLEPIIDMSNTSNNYKELSNTKTVSFHIEDRPNTNLNVSLYRLTDYTNGFNKIAHDLLNKAASVTPSDLYEKANKSADFVYYLNAGATRCPYQKADSTLFYAPGTQINAGTLNLDELRLDVDKHEVSDLTSDESAYFRLSMSSSTQVPGASGTSLESYSLSLIDATNKNGAKLYMDGQAFAAGRSIMLVNDGSVIEKVLEVKRAAAFDYDDIVIMLCSNCDSTNWKTVTLSVHYMPLSTPLRLSNITDNWVMNTLSPRDSIGYYLPIEIDGFSTQNPNFDHIEFQYKMSSQPDEAWVNLCSYYANDSLYNAASGTKGRIENGIISNIHFYGERDPMEQQYDLRAVSFTRHGSGFLTASSPVLTGTKDTRCPALFGTPDPTNGILGMGEFIRIPFSEKIAGNHLDEDNNFEVVGYTNEEGITATTSLHMDGQSTQKVVSSVVRSVFPSGFTFDVMINPADGNKDCIYFAQGNTHSETGIWFGWQDKHLALGIAYIEEDSIISKAVLSRELTPFKGWTRIAVTMDENGLVHFYVGSEDVTNPAEVAIPLPRRISGHIYLGNMVVEGYTQYAYEGNMLEARLWNRALTSAEIAQYNQRYLTGYERGLTAYYPLSEGIGTTCYDIAHGANLEISGPSWIRPEGLALELTGSNTEGIRLAENAWARNSMQDYTLSLWFNAAAQQLSDTAAIFAAGLGTTTEVAAEGHLFIGIEKGALVARQNGKRLTAKGNYRDGEWHHMALSVNHGRNIATLMVDEKTVAEGAATHFTGITTGDLRLGACFHLMPTESGELKEGNRYPFTGSIDDVVLMDAAMSTEFLTLLRNSAPNPRMMNLLAYLNFQHSTLNSNGIYETTYSPYNAKIYKDAMDQEIDKKERLVKTADEEVARLMTKNIAPIVGYKQLSKMNFDWVSRDNELVLNLKMADREINKNNIFVSLRDVEDLAGNLMVNPISFTIFVDRNPLRWGEINYTAQLYRGTSENFTIDILNTSGKSLNYTIDNLPQWLECEMGQGTIQPSAALPVRFALNRKNNLSVGEHMTTIYLTDENGLSEGLDLYVVCEGNAPDWTPVSDANLSMNVIGQVLLNRMVGNKVGTYVDDNENDIVGAFIGDECVGRVNISRQTGLQANVFMSIHGARRHMGEQINFRLWSADQDITYMLKPARTVTFRADTIYGTSSTPLSFTTSNLQIQSTELTSGWNWVSFNLQTPSTLSELLADEEVFQQDDMIKSYHSEGTFSTYQAEADKWVGSLDSINYHNIYMVKVSRAGWMNTLGYKLKSDAQRTVSLAKGWNQLPYLLEHMTTVDMALADYMEKASAGDIIKSYNEFAVFDAESRHWVGSLHYMRPGEGYMLRRGAKSNCRMTYYENTDILNTTTPHMPKHAVEGETHTMSLIARVVTETPILGDDMLCAFVDGKCVGKVMPAEDGIFYLSLSAKPQSKVWFGLIRDGRIIETSAPCLTYTENSIAGTLKSPMKIVMKTADTAESNAVYKVLENNQVIIIRDGERYRLDGMRL